VLTNQTWSQLALQAFWLALPVLVAGIVQICIIKAGWLRALAEIPLDGGLHLRGRRLFGANKTLRGAMIMPLVSALVSTLQARVGSSAIERLCVAPYQINHPAVWGLLLGVGYVLGELPNSLIKRQLGISPGAAAKGRIAMLFWLADQWDSVVGIFLVLGFVWIPSIRFAITVFAMALVLHLLVAAVMVAMGLKERIG
jgi:CDP-archaeol synthase